MSMHEISNNSTLWVVGAFLLITMVVGLYSGRGIKTIKEYALGDGKFSTFTLVLTFLATYIGGGAIIGTTNEIFLIGLLPIVSYFGAIIQHLILAYIISPKIIHFNKCLTMGDLINKLYGKKYQLLIGALSLVTVIFSLSIQLFMLGKVFNVFLGINIFHGIILSGLFLGTYSALGGMKAVAITDVIQFLILIIVLPLIAGLLLKNVGGYKNLILNLPKEKLDIFNNKYFFKYFTFFLMVGIFPRLLISPPTFHRMLLSKNKNQLKNQFLVSSVIDPVVRITIMIIGLSAIVLYPNVNSKEVIPSIINNLFSDGIAKGLAISGIIAIIMSTADSYLHSGGLVLSNDIILNLFKLKNNNKKQLFLAKISTVFVAIVAIIIANEIHNGWNFRSVNIWRSKISAPVLLFPIFIGILGIKTDKKSFLVSIFFGVVSSLISHYYLIQSMKTLSVPIGILSSTISYLLTHLFINKGIKLLKREKDNSKTTEKPWEPSLEKTFNWIYSFIPTPRKIFDFSRESVIKHGTFNVIFGIYCCVNFTLAYFMWDHEVKETYDFMIYLRLIGGTMAGLCIVKDQWKEFLKPYFPLFWHATLLFCLPFVTTLMFFLTHGSFTWLFSIATSIFFLILLVDGPMFCILGPLGVALGIGYYKWQFGPLNMSALGFDTNYYLIYQILFPTIISLLFAYRKKFFYLIRGNQGVNLGLSLCHELRNTGLQALPSSQYLNRKALQIEKISFNKTNNIYELDKKMMDFMINTSSEVEKHTKNTIRVVSTFEKLLLEFRNSLSNPQICSMKSIIEYTLDEYSFLPGQKEKVSIRLYEDFYAKIPKEAFSFVISNIIRNSYKHGKATDIKLWLENHKLHIWDNGKGVPASEITEIFKLFYTTGDQTSGGVGLAFAKQIVQSFYGEIWCESEEGKNSYTEFIIKFPEVYAGEITDKSLQTAEKEGEVKGKKYSEKQIASRMIREGESPETIEKFTELSVSEIQELIREYKGKK